ncbi:hypothetical protein PRZ48_001302 [Zasmidium cellare]|uniref:Sec39 domain-containing protein n=1 Tax=Zasmidium cellare TaxID=395010 RepID=A0ABR0F0V9_ZASCE|nr:hypothetical protein PRZ48_001302 [Zasmidium cellare]
MDPKDLTPAQCVLLTVHLASESNIKALHTFTPSRLDALDPELVLRILLTYLPEALDPREYTNYVEEVASRLYVNIDREDVEVNTSPVKDISDAQAQKRVKKLHLLKIQPPSFPPHAPKDLLTWFLCHRAYRIDEETGLLNLVPALIEPFINRNDFIRTWYIAVVLPLLRMEIEYYPEDEKASMPLPEFEALSGRKGIDVLMSKASEAGAAGESAKLDNVGRDIKSLVGPWMYGHTERKRRRLDHDHEQERPNRSRSVEDVALGVRKIALEGVSDADKTGHDWEYMYRWLVHHAVDNFELVSRAVEEWEGPGDVDLGGFDRGGVHYLDEEEQQKLELQYAQAAFASCYAAQANSPETVQKAHDILARLAELLEFIPPPDLATSVDSLPRIERHATKLDQSQTVADLLPDALLQPEHPLTTPRLETYMLLQMMVYSAYQFSGLGYPLSLVNVARLHFYSTPEEQIDVLTRILRHLSKNGSRRDDTQWTADRAKLLWLWNWGIEPEENDNLNEGSGVLGKIPKETFEEEMLKTFVDTSCFELINSLYISNSAQLSPSRVEQIVLDKAMEAYDSASNGNRTRGGMKRANDIITAFRPRYPNSTKFQEAGALISATHALSFYSLTLQHGVPFQPVSIRVSHDPISLISKVLEQNPRSYTKLDDLIEIARNLVSAGLHSNEDDETAFNNSKEADPEALGKRRKDAERRVTFMAIQAALSEHDFETAYSYIVSRLTPSGADIDGPNDDRRPRHQKTSSRSKNDPDDDISWRAAFLAGRYRPQESAPTLRRLEQRTELLSLALLLAPGSALTEILAAWRRCEEEMTSLQLAQQQEEDEFDDRADKRMSSGSSALPGNFTVGGEQPQLILNQKRREMGRMGAANRGNDETPLSMFDLTRNAARAFSKNAFPLQGAARSSGEQERSMEASTGSLGSERPTSPSERVRKRDMVANAASGALASGLGWVLGATPNQGQGQER